MLRGDHREAPKSINKCDFKNNKAEIDQYWHKKFPISNMIPNLHYKFMSRDGATCRNYFCRLHGIENHWKRI